jgi:hypothetical protein
VPEHFQANEKEAKERSAKNAKVQIVLNPFIKLFAEGGFSKNWLGHGETSLAIVVNLVGVSVTDGFECQIFDLGNAEAHPIFFGDEGNLVEILAQIGEFNLCAILCKIGLGDAPKHCIVIKRIADDRDKACKRFPVQSVDKVFHSCFAPVLL